MPKKHSRPLTILRTVAAHWGWRALKRFTYQLPAEAQFDERLVTWYESGIATGTPRDLFLQINEYPIGQKVVYSAAVYAPRFRLNSLWHVFKLPGGTTSNSRRIVELCDWLHCDNFASQKARAAYRLKHPETIGYSWKRIAKSGPLPIIDPKSGLRQRTK